jgi:hypothetical protein
METECENWDVTEGNRSKFRGKLYELTEPHVSRKALIFGVRFWILTEHAASRIVIPFLGQGEQR